MTAASHYFTMISMMITLAVLVNESMAFSVQPAMRAAGVTTASRGTTQLAAWSIPTPADMRAFTSLTSSWYNEYNPTARRTVYKE
jgi:hypothetical protein